MTEGCFPNRGLCIIAILCAVSLSCAGNSQATREPTRRAANGPRLDLGIRLTDGSWLELADLRGTAVLVFVFATFDVASQANLKSLRPFIPQHPEVIVVGVAAQPHAEPLVQAWAYALDPPFVVGADPRGSVETGTSMLGKIEIVPTFILFDAEGYEVDRTTGLLSEGDLARFVEPLTGKRTQRGHTPHIGRERTAN